MTTVKKRLTAWLVFIAAVAVTFFGAGALRLDAKIDKLYDGYGSKNGEELSQVLDDVSDAAANITALAKKAGVTGDDLDDSERISRRLFLEASAAEKYRLFLQLSQPVQALYEEACTALSEEKLAVLRAQLDDFNSHSAVARRSYTEIEKEIHALCTAFPASVISGLWGFEK